jgi:hypothetical protein
MPRSLLSIGKDGNAKSAASIDGSHATHTSFPLYFLEQEVSKVMDMSSSNENADGNLGKIAHIAERRWV